MERICSNCKYKRSIPIWVTAMDLKIRDVCCRTAIKDIDVNDTCGDWENAFTEKD